MKTFLGIDYGEKRIGLAVGNDQTKLARPLEILLNDERLMINLKEITRENQPTAIILGLPRGLDGQETDQTKTVRKFAQTLKELEVPVELQDEAVTSELVGSSSKTPADDRAAALILQDYLDAL